MVQNTAPCQCRYVLLWLCCIQRLKLAPPLINVVFEVRIVQDTSFLPLYNVGIRGSSLDKESDTLLFSIVPFIWNDLRCLDHEKGKLVF